ncbi:MAG: hypothetical protein LC104_11475 [Bacteroidales bacterium]|nr:hypothetical protein [Bacteroidales bacterium]
MIMRVDCPSCGAVLRSTNPKGFTPGTPISCPKCKQWFSAAQPPPPSPAAPVRAAAVPQDDPPSGRRKKPRRKDDDDDDDDEDDRPRKKGKKGKKKKNDLVGSYTKSPMRAIVIAALIVVLGVLSLMLHLKWKRVEEHNRKIDEEINGAALPPVREGIPLRV